MELKLNVDLQKFEKLFSDELEDYDYTLLEALQDHTTVYSYDDNEVVYARF